MRPASPPRPQHRARSGLALALVLALTATGCAAPAPGTPVPPSVPAAAALPSPVALASPVTEPPRVSATPPPRAADARMPVSMDGPLGPAAPAPRAPVLALPAAATEPPADPAASPVPGSGLAATPRPDGIDPGLAEMLEKLVERSPERIPAPGLAVAVRFPDGRIWSGAAGSRRLSPERPMEPGTVFAIASITKTFIAARVLQLVEEGRIELDERVGRYLPGMPAERSVTVRQLLAHRSGIADYFVSDGYLESVFDDRDRTWTPDEILAWVGDPVCEPDACFHYSNSNFVILGLLIEEVTGRPLAREIRQSLLEPAGLDGIIFQPDDPTPRDAAHGHLWAGGRSFYDQSGNGPVVPHRSAVTAAWAAGAMAASAPDLARWAALLYGGDLLGAGSRAAMTDARDGDGYGLGTRVDRFADRRAVGHLGGIRGFVLAMWYFPESGISIVVLVNRGIASTEPTVKLVAKAVFERWGYTGGTEDPSPTASPAPSPAS